MGKPSTQTLNQQTTLPSYVSDAQKNLYDAAGRITAPFLQNAPDTTVAGFTPDQQRAFDMARWSAQGTYDQAAPPAVAPGTQPYDTATNIGQNAAGSANTITGSLGPNAAGAPNSFLAAMAPQNAATATASTAAPSGAVSAATADPAAGQVGGSAIQALLNPFTQSVLDPTIAAMRRQLGITQAQLGARDASSAAFGGSREALQSGELNRAFGDQVAQTTGQLMAQGFDHATATALANAANAQQAGQFNAGQQNQTGEFNIGQQNQVGQFNAAQLNDIAARNAAAQNAENMYNATNNQNANQFAAQAANNRQQFNADLFARALAGDQSAQNQMQQFNASTYAGAVGNDAGRAAQLPLLQSNLMTAQQQRQLSALQAMLGIGGTQQQNAQSVISQPIDMLKLLGSIVSGTTNSTVSRQQPNNSPTGLQSILGLGLGLGMLPVAGGGSLLGNALGSIGGGASAAGEGLAGELGTAAAGGAGAEDLAALAALL